MRNKKSQLIILKIMVGVMLFIVAMMLSTPVVETVTVATNASNLDCSNTTLSSTQNATCVVTDAGIFYFVAVMIALSVAMITGRKSITGIMTSIFVFIVTVMLIEPLKDFIILFRDSGHLDCGNAAASTGAKLACLVVDLWLFWFIAVILATLVTVLFNKKVAPFIGLGKEK